MKKKKALATMLAAVMALGMTACGSTNTTSSSTSSTDTTSTNSKDNTSSSSAAQTTADEGDPYEVVLEWPAIGNTPTEENLQKIEAAINEVTVPEINCTVKLYPVELNELSNANTLAISTGEKVDLIVSVNTGVGTLVDQGLIVPMDEYVDTYGADIQQKLGDALSNGIYQNQLYGVSNAYIQAESYGFIARADLLDAAGVEIDESKVYTLDELSDILDTVAATQQVGNGFYMVANINSTSDIYTSFFGTVDALGASTASGGLLLTDGYDNTTIENIYASDAYADYAKTMYDWAQKGYIPADAASNTDDGQVQLKTGNYFGEFYWTTPGGAAGIGANVGYDFKNIHLAEPYKKTSQSILWSIPTTSENPQKAFEFLNLLYGDNNIDDTLMFGLEGETYQVVEDNGTDRIVKFIDGIDAASAPYYCYAGVYGDRLTWSIWEPNTIDFNQQLRDFNDTITAASPALGYSFEITDDISSAYSAVSAVVKQYTPTISAGAADPDTYLPQFIQDLETAGINDVIAENQKQFDAWRAAK